jgi:ATP-dependent helicase YprA (DUF1998 family)
VEFFNPFAVSDHLRGTFLRYMADAHPTHPADTSLREKLRAALATVDRFVREPLVSIIPSYRPSLAPMELMARAAPPMLAAGLRQLTHEQFGPDRPLYAHQVKAIELIQSGNNVVVATGTGSGKTECFLLPIMDHVVRHTAPGVQAIIIYPMNALANDQLDRMRRLVGNTPITFGRYTGQTVRSEADVPPEMWAEVQKPNEKFTREEIRKSPPQLLLTNFAMLEYLLLRPQDQEIFELPSVRYVVLDEAHSYSGAQGIDISLLMRRLQRLFPRKLQFILTSATLGDESDPDVRNKISAFATQLCGSAFAPEDVVFGNVDDPFAPHASVPPPTDFAKRLEEGPGPGKLLDVAQNEAAVEKWLLDIGISPVAGATPLETLYRSLCQCEPVHALYRTLRQQPHSVSELAQVIFGQQSETEKAAVRVLLTAASLARLTPDSSPLMAVRLHHFFRGLAGASVALEPMGSAAPSGVNCRVRSLLLQDARIDEETGEKLVGIQSCAHCGLPVVAVRVAEGQWTRGDVRSADPRRLLTWIDLDADESDEDDDAVEERPPLAQMCMECGGYSEEQPLTCGHPSVITLRVVAGEGVDAEGNLLTCPCCGGAARPYPSVLRNFVTGEDAPTAVLAEELVRQMPSQKVTAPAGGRRLLAFSDSRQRAAYFTPYLSRTTAEPAFVHPLLTALDRIQAKYAEPRTIGEVIEEAHRVVLAKPWVVRRKRSGEDFETYEMVPVGQANPQQRREIKTELALTAYQHITAANSQRTKVTGQMLAAAEVEFTPAEVDAVAAMVPELFGDRQKGMDALQRLLMGMVRRGAVAYEHDLLYDRIVGQGPSLVAMAQNFQKGSQGKKLLIRFNPWEAPSRSRKRALGQSRFASIVGQVLGVPVVESETRIRQTLDLLWQWLTTNQQVLVQTEEPGEYQIPASRLLLRIDRSWFRCQRCGTPTIHGAMGTCELSRCQGTLTAVSREEWMEFQSASHLSHRYRQDPMPLIVKEHTAQITLERGRAYQDAFNQHRINVLSSSTTFEMGVDVGQLEAVLLRNVPPSASNYIQRAGRAGRRKQGVAHAVTYARSVPHDQYHYFEPRGIVHGRVPVPVIYTANVRLTQRHINSYLLGRFLKAHRMQLEADNPQLSSFFPGSDIATRAPADLFVSWCQTHRDALARDIAPILASCPLPPDVAVKKSADTIFSRNVNDTLTAYHRGFRSQVASYQLQIADLLAQQREQKEDLKRVRGLIGAQMHVEALLQQLRESRLIDFLAEEHWLPSYAFPQDVVRLTVRQETDRNIMRLERDREMGISEYAPGSEIIADGKLFASVGVNLEAREPKLRYFRTDPAMHSVYTGDTEDEVKQKAPGVKGSPMMFLEPSGFTTSYDDPVTEPNLFRMRPPSNTEVFLLSGAEGFEPHPRAPGVISGICANAKLFRANLGKRGRGFRLCLRCGLGWSNDAPAPANHQTPWGSTCRGQFKPVALAHVFETDVLQIRFPGAGAAPVSERAFWLTLATALTSTACVKLSIDPKDMGSTYRSQSEQDQAGELVLFDRVPGGAGHVQRIRDDLPEILKLSLGKLRMCSNTDCDIEASCYACLRSYKNQFDWDHLRRSAPLLWLERLCGNLGAKTVCPLRTL